ncbi:orotidine-5'-phosphate decarboxylase [Chlorobium phaeovibrioides]|uniref:Orotidine-5'-phosphate decarboxylase n=1 Tax=Chlorobium phaeovibrioides (strain DSM 265 / 1930) TaxID=290318 RepID=A4SCF5_CHLPM|nr:orotidine-5'-phosphate decarboxylase [Chlorobium phaeovibrioides]RTY34626.1 orotidine-5'-phosphate decarboxylase [Chlorobium phaeovibrioides]HCD36794.1 orotidine-5'-phosphate decarboxylase [Chlorobium sp.]
MSAARNKANQRIAALKSLLCVGLDTDPGKIPEVFSSCPNPVLEFNRSVIRATCDSAVSYKINTAFYESRGIEGLRDMEATLREIPGECLAIADAKRADIGNTSRMYARAFFEHWSFDAITVAPYMGEDSLEPFFSYSDKLVFVLCLTSNAGSADFEEQRLEGGEMLYQRVLDRVSGWSCGGNGGVVVGATKSAMLADIRSRAPGLFFLIPGVGAQGGSLEEAAEAGVDADRCSALINISRSLIYPAGTFGSIGEYEEAVALEARRVHEAVRKVL